MQQNCEKYTPDTATYHLHRDMQCNFTAAVDSVAYCSLSFTPRQETRCNETFSSFQASLEPYHLHRLRGATLWVPGRTANRFSIYIMTHFLFIVCNFLKKMAPPPKNFLSFLNTPQRRGGASRCPANCPFQTNTGSACIRQSLSFAIYPPSPFLKWRLLWFGDS